MVRDIRNLEYSLGKKAMFVDDCVKESRIKLERSIASNRTIKKGETITQNDIHLLSPGDGYKWEQKELVIGKKAIFDIKEDEIIYKKLIK